MKELEPSIYLLCFPAPLLLFGRAFALSFTRALLIPEGHCLFAFNTALSRTTANPVYRSLTSR